MSEISLNREDVKTVSDLKEPKFKSRSSDIFQWSDGVLLKLFHSDVDDNLIQNEFINTTETFEKGVSKIECYGLIEIEGRKGILMKEIPGKTMLGSVGKMPWLLLTGPKIMAQLHVQLHSTKGEKIRKYKDFVFEAMETEPLKFLTDEERALATEKISALPDGDRILHFDYHQDNIMTDKKDNSIIDWMTAALGVPQADVAATLYLGKEGEMIPGLSPFVARILEMIRKGFCDKYYKNYKKMTGMTDEEVAPWRLPFLIVRLGVWNIESEVDDLQKKIRIELEK